MQKKNKISNIVGLGLTVLMALGSLVLIFLYLDKDEPEAYALFHAGVDLLGAFVSAVLFYGVMWQVEEETRSFSVLVLLVSASFVVNEVMWFTVWRGDTRMVFFICCLLGKWLNLAMIYCFFLYVRKILHFEGKLAKITEKGAPILLGISMLIVLSNAITPVTFFVDAAGQYGKADLSFLEDIFLAVISLITTVLIFRSHSPARQKWTAMSFILIPVVEFLATKGAFAYSTQYGAVLLSLILMYCILFNDRSKKLAATQTELTMATQIQEAMLPSIFPAFPERREFDLYASMDPAKEVGGDFYDFFLIDEDHLGLIIADVSGKGVPAALYMMISKTILQNYAKLGIGPAEVLQKTNDALSGENRTEMFVTAWVGILDIPEGTMRCANAGHEYPAVLRDGRFELLKDKHGFVLGGMKGMKYKEYSVEFKKGDKLFVYTDGVPEATNLEKTMFGTDRMLETLNAASLKKPKEILTAVRSAVDVFVGGAEQFDDLTMLCMEYKGTAENA